MGTPKPQLESLAPSHARQIDRLCDQFESVWLGGQRPSIAAYLEQLPDEDRRVLFSELLALDVAYRVEAGEAPSVDEYLGQFPGYSEAIGRALGNPTDSTIDVPTTDAAPTLAPAPDLPTAIGRYRVVARLGVGGQSEVYRAVHPTLEHDVVIKLARRSLGASAGQWDRLLVEGKLLAQLHVPGLARVYDLDLHEGRPFLVMEYLRGRTLRQRVGQQRMDWAWSARVVATLARGLAQAHRHGVIHQDIKPDNIVLDENDRPMLIDFGLARLQHVWSDEKEASGSIAGTAAYMPPEQARGQTDAIDARSDLFGLGGVLYFLLAGKGPFAAADFAGSLERAQRGDVDRGACQASGAPRGLVEACLRALEPEPNDRFASADDMAEALESLLPAALPARRRRWRWLVAIVLLLAAAGGVGAWWVATHKPAANAAASAAPLTKPSWNRQTRELTYRGEVVRRIRSLKQATSIVPVLDAFEEQGWPRQMACPAEGNNDPRWVYAAVRSLNIGSEGMKFNIAPDGLSITWEPDEPH